jgi:hypothetical protein
VRLPKYPSATPAGIVRNPFETKNDWRATTSLPVEPTERLFEKTYALALIANAPMTRADVARLAIKAFFIYLINL